MTESTVPPPAITLAQAFWYRFKLGFISFGGPAGLVAGCLFVLPS